MKKKRCMKIKKICYICEKQFCADKNNEKKSQRSSSLYRKIQRSRPQYYLRYKIPREIPVVFHNGSTYDYHFIIKQLAKEFKGNFDCLGENTEKYITFSVPNYKRA